jgi:hypothetical protein
MTKEQRIVIAVAAALLIAVYLFPPYLEPKFDKDGKIYGTYTKWEFNQALQDGFRKTDKGEIVAHGVKFGYVPMITYSSRDDLQLVEIFGILVLAGVALLIVKKKRV